MISHGKNVKVFCANANRPFAEGVCRKLWLPLGDCTVTTFADGEVSLTINEVEDTPAGTRISINLIPHTFEHTSFKYTKKRYGTGRRVFLMAPIHHHFELMGWSETQIVTVFATITAILCLIALMGL